MVATAFIATQRGGSEAFAQGTGGERRVVAQGVYAASDPWGNVNNGHWGYRIWSDNVTEVRHLGFTDSRIDSEGVLWARLNTEVWSSAWQSVDDGTVAFMPTDIDRSGQIDSGDIAQVLLNFNETVDQTTPPPIDCNINAPR